MPSIKMPCEPQHNQQWLQPRPSFSAMFNNQITTYINQHQSTKRPLLYIYLHAVSSLSIWWRTTRRTNQHFYCTNHNPHTTIHPSTMLFLFVLLSLARLLLPSFHFVPFLLHHVHSPLTKNHQIHIYILCFVFSVACSTEIANLYHTT